MICSHSKAIVTCMGYNVSDQAPRMYVSPPQYKPHEIVFTPQFKHTINVNFTLP
jgi:hypothetical protein